MGRRSATGAAHDTLDALEVRYLSADDPTEWLLGELVEFYDGDQDRVAELMANLEDRYEALCDTIIDPDALVAFEVLVRHSDHDSIIAMSGLPHPVELLWTLCQHAHHGDIVMINHRHVRRSHGVTLRWPFSIDDAIVATSPDLRAASAEAEYAVLDTSRAERAAAAAITAAVAAAGAALGYLVARRRR